MRVILLVWLGSAIIASAATYYIDCANGRDTNIGLDPANGWQTIGKANQRIYGPGDSILLKRGCVWRGPGFKASGNGNALAPIVLADYGDTNAPRPIIDGVGAHEPAILLQNVQNWTV